MFSDNEHTHCTKIMLDTTAYVNTLAKGLQDAALRRLMQQVAWMQIAAIHYL